MGFTKLWSEILHSSIWFQPDEVLRVWIYLLALCGPDGIAKTCAPDIAERCRIKLDRTREIISILESPDIDSRTETDEGRRIRKCEGGFFLVNYHKYREMRDDSHRREYMRNYMEKYRSEGKLSKLSVNSCKLDVTDVKPVNPLLAQAEAEAEAEEEEKEKEKNIPRKPGNGKSFLESSFAKLWSDYPSRNGQKVGKKKSLEEWKKLNPNQNLISQILEALQNQINHQKDCQYHNEFCSPFPDLERWIKHRRWEDIIKTPSWKDRITEETWTPPPKIEEF